MQIDNINDSMIRFKEDFERKCTEMNVFSTLHAEMLNYINGISKELTALEKKLKVLTSNKNAMENEVETISSQLYHTR